MDSRRYLQYALLTATAAVLGLLLVRSRSSSGATLAFEALSNRLTYVYLFAVTAAVFLGLGYVLGRRIDRLSRLATTDPLTGLANRRAFQSRLRDEWKVAVRERSSLSLLLIDIDGLKRVNDQLGHQAGDQVLRTAAHAIGSTMRDTDLGARWGGDECAIVAPNTAQDVAERLGRRLAGELEQRARARDVNVTASVGIVTMDPRNRSASMESFVASADAALYRAKHEGRNRIKMG
jgi:diguanylate cyclase (GGDEF)-like protein